MTATILTYFLLAQLPGIVLAMGMGRAAANADRELSACALAQGRPDLAAFYLQGCAA